MSDRGLGLLERALRVDPGDPALVLELACRYARAGRAREAFTLCTRAEVELPTEVERALADAQLPILSRLGAPDAQVATGRDPGSGEWLWRDLLSHLERPGLRATRALNLPWRRLSVSELDALTSLTSLEELRLTGWDEARGRLRALERLPHLRSLALDYAPILDSDLPRLCALPLEELDLAHCAHLGGESLGPLPRLALRRLDLSYTHATDAVLRELSGHEQLEELRLQDCQRVAEIEALAACPRLRLLDLAFCQGVHRDSIDALRSARPGLKVLV